MTKPVPHAITPSARRRLALLPVAVLATTALLAACAPSPEEPQPEPEPTAVFPSMPEPTISEDYPGLLRARKLLGEPRSGKDWHSGIWAGGDMASGERVEAFGEWRGTPVDAITMYPSNDTWEKIRTSEWHITTFDASPAVLSYGLPLLPVNSGDTLLDVAEGKQDAVFREVADLLVAHGRGTTIVRVGWEANGAWFPWNATANTAEDFKAAYRRVVSVMKEQAPDLIFDFDIGCGVSLRGQTQRLDALTMLYPGDDVVDLIGCDTYDWHHTTVTDEASWKLTQRPKNSPGIADVADFAKARGKGLSYPEWGVASEEEGGAGDNPFFIEKMRGFFEDHSDILVLEAYFSEPETSLANSIWDPVQMPLASEEYLRLWGGSGE
ncbi:MAG TPA: glycosyl hydrolase [Arachnia sp.]|nr:glycosyl hydrolase [Arachnia sp.]HMT85202.1 glycosyl hydrolase [Arachnia sp.]